jgi:AcrR family transcriptional regulator
MAAGKSAKWERRPEARVPELLEAALHVFAESGYRRTRLDDVANRAGVTKGTIYHYVDTKESLLLAVIEHYQAIAFGRIEEVLRDQSLDESARLGMVVRRTFVASHEGRRPLLALLIRGIATEVPRVHERWLRDGPVRLWTVIAGIIADGQRNGQFNREVDAAVAARGLVSSLLLQLMWRQHARSVPGLAIDEARMIEQSITVLLAALRPA